jgi:hypothetical protein
MYSFALNDTFFRVYINIYIHINTVGGSRGCFGGGAGGGYTYIYIYWVPERRYYVPQIRHIHIVLRATVVSLYIIPSCVRTYIYTQYNNPLCSVFLPKVYILYAVLRAAPELQPLLLFCPPPRTYNIHTLTIHTHLYIIVYI